MSTIIVALFAIVLVVIYLGYYAIMLHSVPLWIIIVGVLFMPVVDFIQTLRKERQNSKK